MLRLLKNPFYIYVLGFTLVLITYNLKWSNIYPELTTEMKIFLMVTFVFSILFGLLIDGFKLIKKSLSKTNPKLISSLFYIVLVLYSFEFLYEQDVPLLAKLAGRPGVSYKEFGIPLLHGILISLNSFLIAHTFNTYMSSKGKRILFYNVLLYLPALLIINRSIIVLGVLTSLFIYLHFVGKVTFKNKIKLGVLSLFGLYLFGVIGNLRSGGKYIYTESDATKNFMESSIPKEYYWTYLYVASPLANFQNTVNNKYVENLDFTGFLFYENLPQIISKNLGSQLNIEPRDLVRIVPWLTVGTTYAKSFSYLGWGGPYLLFFANFFIYFFLFFLVPRSSSYHVTIIAILSVIVLLNIFTNMLIVTGISFQLAYCILFAFFERKTIVLRAE